MGQMERWQIDLEDKYNKDEAYDIAYSQAKEYALCEFKSCFENKGDIQDTINSVWLYCDDTYSVDFEATDLTAMVLESAKAVA